MKHTGIARRAAFKIIIVSLAITLCACCIPALVRFLAHGAQLFSVICLVVILILGTLWLLFALFTVYFFRDPPPNPPPGPGLVVSPGHGKVDAIEQINEPQFMGGPCHRISIFLSVINVHVQNAPISGKINCVVHTPGKFISALQADSAVHNENVLIGFDSRESAGEKIGLRLIAGVLARRIVPFVKTGDEVERGDRISLIQFGSRCDLYLPLHYKIKSKVGDKVVGGVTIMATR